MSKSTVASQYKVEVAILQPMGNTHVGILGYSPCRTSKINCKMATSTLNISLEEANVDLIFGHYYEHFPRNIFCLEKLGPQPPKVCSN